MFLCDGSFSPLGNLSPRYCGPKLPTISRACAEVASGKLSRPVTSARDTGSAGSNTCNARIAPPNSRARFTFRWIPRHCRRITSRVPNTRNNYDYKIIFNLFTIAIRQRKSEIVSEIVRRLADGNVHSAGSATYQLPIPNPNRKYPYIHYIRLLIITMTERIMHSEKKNMQNISNKQEK